MTNTAGSNCHVICYYSSPSYTYSRVNYQELDPVRQIVPIRQIQLDKYVNLNLQFSCEICLNVGDVDHELHFCDRIPNERN